MKVKPATVDDETCLLELMWESHVEESADSPEEWATTKTAIRKLLRDHQAGEAFILYNDAGEPVGYMILCRGFSLDYGGYFTWLEESYIRHAEHARFRDKRYSPE
ncbi:MAG: hypothetical protein D6784_13240 [Chloroflexi bacterium]|nr:MAG: hypothetical protein D6784_13240 [Chloroflexota bacterium]